MNSVLNLLNHYGYIVLFVSLLTELMALPNPNELLMMYCGFLVYQGKMSLLLSILAAAAGAWAGMTLSYWIGAKLGFAFFRKYGHFIHMGPEKLEKTSLWFEKYGNRLLVISCFIPGVRHITGYFSGITKISYKKYALKTCAGALLWTGTFISLGKVLGPNWEKYKGPIDRYLIIVCIVIAAVMIIRFIYQSYKARIIKFILDLLVNGIEIFNSLGKIKLAIAGAAVVCLTFFALVIGLVQDFLANEFSQFDNTVSFIGSLIFTKRWEYSMNFFKNFTSIMVLIPVAILMLLWILLKGINKGLEIRFFAITVLGSVVLDEGLRLLFHRVGPLGLSAAGLAKYTFPSQQTFLAIAIYGFLAFLILRHANRVWPRTIAVIAAFIVCILTALSLLFFQEVYPSDITAGFIFGGFWLFLNIILLEIYRVLHDGKAYIS